MGPNTLIALDLASALLRIVEQAMVTKEDVPMETLNAMSERLQNRINTFQAKLDAAP
jgi:hypothetical protein